MARWEKQHGPIPKREVMPHEFATEGRLCGYGSQRKPECIRKQKGSENVIGLSSFRLSTAWGRQTDAEWSWLAAGEPWSFYICGRSPPWSAAADAAFLAEHA